MEKPSGVEQTETGISETYLEEMRTDLENISEYLTQLDASVTGNKEELVSLTEIRNGNYEELTEYLEGMKNVISGNPDGAVGISEQPVGTAGGFQPGVLRI